VAATDLLQRSVSDARVAGVCGGIAERYRIDPLLVRIVAVIIALSSGVGIVLYGAAWLLLPRGSEQPALVRAFPTVDRVRSRTWIVLVAGAVVVVLVVVGSAFDVSLMPTMVVLGILYASQLRPGSRSAVQSVPDAQTYQRMPESLPQPQWPLLAPPPGDLIITTPAGPWRPTNRWGQPLSAKDCATYFSVPDPVGLYEHRASAPPQRRSRVLAVISGLAIAAFFAMLSLLGAFVKVPPVTYLAAGLILVGVALVVGAFLGRPRGFIAIATALILIAGFQTMDTAGAASPTYKTVTSTKEVPPEVDAAGGDYTLDLSGLRATDDTTTFIHMTTGNVVVLLPKGGNYSLTWTVTSGKVTLPDGTEAAGTGDLAASPDPNKPTTTISVDVLWGDLVIG
jgi:phage shock protein PspC (stress-responsive transcriptional regulator)